MFPDNPPGLHFIQSNIASIQDEKQHLPIGFGINFPSLIEYCRNRDRDGTTNQKRKRVWKKRFGVATIVILENYGKP